MSTLAKKRTSLGLPAVLLAASMAPVHAWEDDAWEDDPWGTEVSAWQHHGFLELAVGTRTANNPLWEDDLSLGDMRFQYEGQYETDRYSIRLKGDALADEVKNNITGDLREGMLQFAVGNSVDVRMGRQILTWGTGDLLFLNDLFPKDWNSFLSGRDDEYLKAPSDALRISWFGSAANLDVAWMPSFMADRYIDGSRLGYYSPAAGDTIANWIDGQRPARSPENSELAMRLYGIRGAQEWALYVFRGFGGQPRAFDPVNNVPTFARLHSLGASIRGPLAGGLYNLETAWHHAPDDSEGDNPNQPNSELRFLAGYEREMITNLSTGMQYYIEWLQDYDSLKDNWPFAAEDRPDEQRHVITVRLTYRMMRDSLMPGLMTFYSPSDEDFFLRPTLLYRHSDQLQMNLGANVFGGRTKSTFYGQFEDETSVYARLRYSF